MIKLLVIADDFTGASDAASFLVKGSMSVQLYNGIPENTKDLRRKFSSRRSLTLSTSSNSIT